MLKQNMRAALMVVAVLAAGEAVCGPAVIPLKLPSGKVLQTELMINDQDRQMGLMFRPSLPMDHALLFVFETADYHGIWMKNCKFPIDIVWLDADHKVVHVHEGAPPCKAEEGDQCAVYTPQRKASYVIEINSGQARKEKIALGSTLEFSLP
ncbi:MAG TPA: DUF192 domain-containing protein [Vicinamibacteria bacterium]